MRPSRAWFRCARSSWRSATPSFRLIQSGTSSPSGGSFRSSTRIRAAWLRTILVAAIRRDLATLTLRFARRTSRRMPALPRARRFTTRSAASIADSQ